MTGPQYFYPRSPCGERRPPNAAAMPVCNFYPRSPCGERLLTEINKLATGQISIHALLAESDGDSLAVVDVLPISIHALLAESDSGHQKQYGIFGISIHALLAESDFDDGIALIPHQQFLSTLSLRRATANEAATTANKALFLSTLSLRRATKTPPQGSRSRIFLSTLSLRRATPYLPLAKVRHCISIHALLAESDR